LNQCPRADQCSLSRILEKTRAGERLGREDILALLASDRLIEIGRAADDLRRRKNPGERASFIIDRNINYTNVCIYRCRFCAFYRPSGHPEAYLLTFEEIAEKIRGTIAAGGTGILLQGGVHPEIRLVDYCSLLSRLKKEFPEIHLHAFSVPEIWYISKAEKIPVPVVIRELIDAGLDSIPGGGAEILEDQTRRRILSRAKAPTSIWLDVHRQAHLQGLRTTATMMFGVGENLDARTEHLLGIRKLQDETGGFTAFIPWTFQEKDTALEGQIDCSGGFDYLRMLAVSRLALDNIQHVQGSWVTQGPKMGQLSLFFGADDLGSIMLEENVVAAAGTHHRMSRSQMEELISCAGLEPRRRRTLYEEI